MSTFPVDLEPTFTVDKVPLTLPGKADPVHVSLTFAHMSRDEREAFDERYAGKPIRDALCEVLRGWGGFSRPYSAEARDALLDNYPTVVPEMWQTFRSEVTKSKRKNW